MSFFESDIKAVYSSKKVPRLRSPILICGFPGSGYVGKLAIDHIIEELESIHLADIYSTSFPPQVIIKNTGIVELMKNILYYVKDSGAKHDFLFLTGDAQPVSSKVEYLLGEEIIKIAKDFGVTQVITLGAYITGMFVETPRVFGVATDDDGLKLLNSYSISKIDTGSISGMNGILLGIGKINNLNGISLLGETSGYVIDANASKYILKKLLSIVDLDIDMEDMEKKAKDTIMLIKSIESRIGDKNTSSDEVQHMVQKKQPEMGYIS
ncbi:MAG TPA: proteasome assembly chaperone family protein [Nitrososphaeraceae archaeon]|nr:proteasome assembly chaperone family protein [Nitrososphaeraceae archaeon]